jgi:hypothetical protein
MPKESHNDLSQLIRAFLKESDEHFRSLNYSNGEFVLDEERNEKLKKLCDELIVKLRSQKDDRPNTRRPSVS